MQTIKNLFKFMPFLLATQSLGATFELYGDACGALALKAKVQNSLYFFEDDAVVVAGFVKDFDRILAKSQGQPVQNASLSEVARRFNLTSSRAKRFAPPALRSVIEALDNKEILNEVIVCVGPCSHTVGRHSRHVMSTARPGYMILTAGEERGIQPGTPMSSMRDLRQKEVMQGVIVFDSKDLTTFGNTDIATPSEVLLHEIRHYLDVLTLDKWVAANKTLISSGLEPDRLFKTYASEFAGELVVAGEFRAFWSESQAFQVTASVLASHRSPDYAASFFSHYQSVGHRDYLAKFPRSAFFQELASPPGGFFAFGNAMDIVMRQTIARAANH